MGIERFVQQKARMIISFDEHCNMQCPFCFARFSGRRPLFSEMLQVLSRLRDMNVSDLTIGGGDPFISEWCPKALEKAGELGFNIYLDTNGVALREDGYRAIVGNVSEVGLPLDGPEFVHDSLRQASGHYQIVQKHFKKLRQLGVRLELNTVITAQNVNSIDQLAGIISDMRPDCWSVHRFVARERAYESRAAFEVSDVEFEKAILCSQAHLDNVHLRVCRRTNGCEDYLFMNPAGDTYVVDTNNQSSYVDAGSIFDSFWDECLRPALSRSGQGAIA